MHDYEPIYGGVATGLGVMTVVSVISYIFSLAVSIYTYIMLALVLSRIFKKAGITGGYAFIPAYNLYLLCKLLWGNGLKMFLLCIPFANIYFAIKLYIDIAKEYGKSAGFGVGMTLLLPIFCSILVFKKEEPVGAMVGTAVAGNYSQSNMQNQPMQAQGYPQGYNPGYMQNNMQGNMQRGANQGYPQQGYMQQPTQGIMQQPQNMQQRPMQNAQPSPFAPQQTQSVQQPNPFAPQQGSDNTNLW